MKKKVSKLTVILYLLLISLICSCIFIYYFEKTLGPSLITCAENEVRYLATQVINNSIKKYHKNNNKINFFEMEKNSQKEITLVKYNTKEINKATTIITEILEKDLLNLTKGNIKELDLNLNTITQEYYEKINDGVIFTISSGASTGNSLLANIGPKIPLKLKLVGEVNTELKSKVTEYGLNNALIEIYLDTKVIMVIQMPFLSKKIIIENKIPLTMEIIQGNIPEYYLGNSTNNH